MTAPASKPGTTTEPAGRPPRRRGANRHRTQEVVLAWCVWLIGSWLCSIALATSKIASRMMMPYAVLLGLVVLWPMLRLSQLRPEEQRQSSRGPAWVLGEWLCLSLVVQAVVWPLMLNAGWGVVQVLWLDLLFVTWGLVAALVIAVGERVATARARILAMVVCVLLVFGEPAALWLLNAMAGGGSVTWPMSLSPVPVIWRITHEFGAGGFLVAAHVFTFLIVAVVGLAITMLDHGRPAERRG